MQSNNNPHPDIVGLISDAATMSFVYTFAEQARYRLCNMNSGNVSLCQILELRVVFERPDMDAPRVEAIVAWVDERNRITSTEILNFLEFRITEVKING